ncbi:MAG: ribosomal protein S18-alanine N-acetyltransferase [Kineothrix sp.]
MIRIRRMEEGDAAWAAAQERACFSAPWSESSFLETIRLSYAFFYVAEAEGEPAGICGCRNLAGEGEISNVSVSEKHRRRGIASALLARVLEDGKRQGIEAFTLEVRCSNQPAIGLYESFGFEGRGIRKNFYEKPREDALIMWKR